MVCGQGFMRKPLLYSHMNIQGHLNDTIVVNQPRISSEHELLEIDDFTPKQEKISADELQSHDEMYLEDKNSEDVSF